MLTLIQKIRVFCSLTYWLKIMPGRLMAGHVVLVHGMEVRPLPGQQNALVAQLVERSSPKREVVGSNPAWCAMNM